MVKRRVLDPKPVLDEAQLVSFLQEHGIKEKHAAKLWRTIVQETPVLDLTAIPYAKLDLPPAMAQLVPRHFRVLTSEVLSQQTSGDGTTTKLVVRLQDGHEVESVIMRHGGGRSTLCVSSQVGCQMGCTFCATGTMGIIGNLHGGEILEQLMHANLLQLAIGGGRIRNVVFMGMGEPLNNYNAVLSAVHGMVDVRRFGLSKSHVTISTVGVLPYMRKLIADAPWVNLALSLHAPTQDLRLQIVPTAKAYPIASLMAEMDSYLLASAAAALEDQGAGSNGKKRRGTKPAADRSPDEQAAAEAAATAKRSGGVGGSGGVYTKFTAMIEYVLLAGVNDQPEQAHQLGRLLLEQGPTGQSASDELGGGRHGGEGGGEGEAVTEGANAAVVVVVEGEDGEEEEVAADHESAVISNILQQRLWNNSLLHPPDLQIEGEEEEEEAGQKEAAPAAAAAVDSDGLFRCPHVLEEAGVQVVSDLWDAVAGRFYVSVAEALSAKLALVSSSSAAAAAAAAHAGNMTPEQAADADLSVRAVVASVPAEWARRLQVAAEEVAEAVAAAGAGRSKLERQVESAEGGCCGGGGGDADSSCCGGSSSSSKSMPALAAPRPKLHFGAADAQMEQLGVHQRKPRDVLVNLIPWNPTGVGAQPYAAPESDVVAEFRNIVASYGLSVTVRKEMGQDIAGACGQLALISKSSNKGASSVSPSPPRDIEDLAGPKPNRTAAVGKKGVSKRADRSRAAASIVEPVPAASSTHLLTPVLFLLLAHVFRFLIFWAGPDPGSQVN